MTPDSKTQRLSRALPETKPGVPVRIVHLGVGNFQGHQVWYSRSVNTDPIRTEPFGVWVDPGGSPAGRPRMVDAGAKLVLRTLPTITAERAEGRIPTGYATPAVLDLPELGLGGDAASGNAVLIQEQAINRL